MVVIIAGSRSFTDIALVRTAVHASGWQSHLQLIIAGRARGIDTLAERFAREQRIPIVTIPADWPNIAAPGAVIKRNARGRYNAAAGMQRNEAMALRALQESCSRNCEAGLLLIWDGKSSGSANMRQIALSHRLHLFEYIRPVTTWHSSSDARERDREDSRR
jgi:hypothetical protein